jgi:SAM-dependent methyltransferase
MKKWVLKAIVQKTISFLPGGHSINYLFQKYVTKGVYLTDAYFFDRLTHAKTHVDTYVSLSANKTMGNTLELGTGWYPVVPISLFLSGAENIYTIDISALLNKESLKTTLTRFMDLDTNGKLNSYLRVDAARLNELRELYKEYDKIELSDALKKLHIKYSITDARNTGFPAAQFDLITSNNTFEHVYPQVLEGILKEFKRIIKPGGVMSHAIDMSDHFAHFDKTINVFNFLQFSDKQWKRIDNSIQPQNRWRITDFRKLYAQLNIPITKETDVKGNIEELQKIKLDSRFASIPIEEVAIIHCHLASIIM